MQLPHARSRLRQRLLILTWTRKRHTMTRWRVSLASTSNRLRRKPRGAPPVGGHPAPELLECAQRTCRPPGSTAVPVRGRHCVAVHCSVADCSANMQFGAENLLSRGVDEWMDNGRDAHGSAIRLSREGF